MDILVKIIRIIYVLVCLLLIGIVLIQKSDRGGASESIVGGAGASNFYEKNKGRTKEGKLKRNTIILSVVFVILTVALTMLS